MRIYLVGFMGVGKTTIGEALGERLEVPFVDLDADVVEASGATVAEIFAAHGEAHFRRLESASLRRTGRLGGCVVATGGGTPEDLANRIWMRRHGRIVWLDAPFSLVATRLQGLSDRPLFADPVTSEQLFESRRSSYRDCDQVVDVEDKSVATIVDEIESGLPSVNVR